MNAGPKRTWKLYRGDELLADLVVTGGDFPWLNARVDAYGAFEEVQTLFADELRLIEDIDDEPDAGEAAYAAIRATLTLLPGRPRGSRAPVTYRWPRRLVALE